MAKLIKNERGFTFVEVVIALAILGVIAAGFLMALATASKAIIIADERTTAESLARSQMEYVKKQGYDGTNNPPQYAVVSDIPSTYSIDISAVRLDPEGDGTGDDDGIQKIIITVDHQGEPVITLVGYKADR